MLYLLLNKKSKMAKYTNISLPENLIKGIDDVIKNLEEYMFTVDKNFN